MEILRDAYLHNFIGDMEGLIFLMFWAALMILGYFIVQVVQYWEERGRFAGAAITPEIPERPDPYELAYLSGGSEKVIHTALARLVLDKYLQVSSEKSKLINTEKELPDWIDPIEKIVYKGLIRLGGLSLKSKSSINVSFKQIEESLSNYINAYTARWQELGLMTTKAQKQKIASLYLGLLIFGLALAGYKLSVAITKGYTNIGFLLLLCLAASALIIGKRYSFMEGVV
jgi:uncharacterized protein (TIGR04222 family)